ncbi:MAG TPA: hypothetical protein VFY87_32095 [Geminicoccaceae bacterium]|nr:hypothetical protein [Geminicoccaceae bacterium]
MIEAVQAALGLLLPDGLAPAVALLLVGTSFFTSMLTGALGLGGGIMMLAVIAAFLPPTVVIPVHGTGWCRSAPTSAAPP